VEIKYIMATLMHKKKELIRELERKLEVSEKENQDLWKMHLDLEYDYRQLVKSIKERGD